MCTNSKRENIFNSPLGLVTLIGQPSSLDLETKVIKWVSQQSTEGMHYACSTTFLFHLLPKANALAWGCLRRQEVWFLACWDGPWRILGGKTGFKKCSEQLLYTLCDKTTFNSGVLVHRSILHILGTDPREQMSPWKSCFFRWCDWKKCVHC